MIRCEWGLPGVALAADAIAIVVDVLSFSTTVCVALEQGAFVQPSADRPPPRSTDSVSLSPQSVRGLAAGTRLTLPSPNGSTLAFAARDVAAAVATACLRNARAVGRWAAMQERPVVVIPAGERWPDGSIRFALEDWLGAGAVIASLTGNLSAEALAARATFRACDVPAAVRDSSSGRELIERGFAEDVRIATELDACDVVPLLGADGYFSPYALR